MRWLFMAIVRPVFILNKRLQTKVFCLSFVGLGQAIKACNEIIEIEVQIHASLATNR